MLLTYGYSAEIPNKLSIFYNQAYEAMFQRHDALKGAFKREKETNLDIQDFGTVCSAFCIQSYDDRRVKFSDTEAISYLERAKQITNINYRSEDFLTDLKQSICMLVDEGLFLTFTHRSFQEFFAARFIVKSEPATKKRFLDRYKSYVRED
jgi:predicted NACHT family NTPase